MPEVKKRPDFIKHYSEIQEADTGTYPNDAELLSIPSDFSKAFGLKRLGIGHEILKPGRRTSWPHAHSVDEEFVFVVEGSPEVWIDGDVYQLRAGDSVGFVPGTGIAHTFINNSDCDVRLIVVGDRGRQDDRWFYSFDEKGNDRAKAKSRFWESHPEGNLGSHDGLPDKVRLNRKAPQN